MEQMLLESPYMYVIFFFFYVYFPHVSRLITLIIIFYLKENFQNETLYVCTVLNEWVHNMNKNVLLLYICDDSNALF